MFSNEGLLLCRVDMCNLVSGANNGVLISARNLLKHALRQLWCARLEKSDKSESFFQLPLTVNVEVPSSSGTEKTTQVYHDGKYQMSRVFDVKK